ncbi:hypothetical protein KC734_12135 [candidate division KSB1 bacterium]|nr:hypothetical protein [candidate division KSB1 bacterium]
MWPKIFIRKKRDPKEGAFCDENVVKAISITSLQKRMLVTAAFSNFSLQFLRDTIVGNRVANQHSAHDESQNKKADGQYSVQHIFSINFSLALI